MKRLIPIGIIAFVFLLALGIVALLPPRKEEKPPVNVPAVNVEVSPVTPLPTLPDGFTLPGVVEPNRVVKVAAEVAGRIEALCCKEGDACRAGHAVLKLNTDLLQAEYDRAKAQLEFDESDFRRQDRLYKQGATNEKDIELARSRMKIGRAAMAAAEAQLKRGAIVAPIDGTLDKLPVEKGEYVQIGQTVAEIVDMDVAVIGVDVPERDVHYFTAGGKAEVVVTLRDEPLKLIGSIRYISELADASTRATRLELVVPNTPRLLRSGQIVEVRLTRRILKDVVMVPLAAVIPMEDSKVVYLAEDVPADGDTPARTVARRRTVQLGFIKGANIRVTDGLKPGDRLIIRGHRFVSDGQSILVRNGADGKTPAPSTPTAGD